ncbi:collagen alpha-1(II) chain-like [Prinia subflava]|uniref:collagen alpha-1(II) chain-like n=1 Tax=Prinia subflava TaxID=208062 RepID=UPI002FE2E07F
MAGEEEEEEEGGSGGVMPRARVASRQAAARPAPRGAALSRSPRGQRWEEGAATTSSPATSVKLEGGGGKERARRRKARGTTFPTREYLGAMCLFPSFGGCAEPKQCGAAAGLEGTDGTGRDGGVPPSLPKLFGTRRWIWVYFFFSFASSLLFLLPPALFVEPNQKCQSVRVSQKGSDYKITETDVGPAHTHPHTEAEARAAPRGRRAGIKQPPTTPAGPPLPPPSSLCPVPSPCPAGCPAGAGPASRGGGGAVRGRAGGPGPRPWAARGLGGSGGRYVPTWARSSLFPCLYSGPLSFVSQRSGPALGRLPASLTWRRGAGGTEVSNPQNGSHGAREPRARGAGRGRGSPRSGPGRARPGTSRGRAADVRSTAAVLFPPLSLSSPLLPERLPGVFTPVRREAGPNFAGGKARGAGENPLSHLAERRGARGLSFLAGCSLRGRGRSGPGREGGAVMPAPL